MNDQSSQKPTTAEAEKRHPRSRLPKKTIAWTILVVVGLAVLHIMSGSLNENYNMDPAIPWVFTMLFGLLTIIIWFISLFFFSKMRLVGLLVLAAPILFFTFYYPNFQGDANFKGFKPRYWSRQSNFVEAKSTPSTVQLTPTQFDFPQFLGANRNATVEHVTLADSWENSPELLWKQDIGEGWSGFSVVNGFAITQEQRGKDECVTCYEIETGDLVWIDKVERRHEDTMAMGKVGPRATPTVDNGLVYCTSGTGVLDCLDGATGDLIWSANVPELVGIKQVEYKNSMGLTYTMEDSVMAWGRSCSPLILEDLVIVTGGGPAPSKEDGTTEPPVTLIAFDKKSGEEKWRGGNRNIAYGSPTVATIGGTKQILLTGEDTAMGFDAATGTELWSHERPGSSNGEANCSQVTPVDENRMILSKGYNMGGEMIEVQNSDGNWTVKSIHKDPRVLKTKLTNPIIYQGHAYSLSDGYLECTEVDTFRRKWKQRGRFGNGQVILVGDKLLVHAEGGTVTDPRSTLYLVKATPDKYTELGSLRTIKGICWNTISLYKDMLLVRSELEAACFRLPLVGGSDPSAQDAPNDDEANTNETADQ